MIPMTSYKKKKTENIVNESIEVYIQLKMREGELGVW